MATPSGGAAAAQPTIRLGALDFNFVDVITPDRNAGVIVEVRPQEHFVGFDVDRAHKHGLGPFCKFSFSGEEGVSEVYALVERDSVCYIGQTIDLRRQLNDIGNIYRAKCYKGGQPTNCKINHRVLEVSQAGRHVALYARPTPPSLQTSLKKQLIARYSPKWNDTSG